MNIGDRMKMYERAFAGDRFMPMLPVLARIDGRAFHGFTKGLDRPFDTNYADCMDLTTIDLVKETNALMGYTQSDEITLLFYTDNIKSQIFFDGRIQKMVSQLGALSTLYFNKYVREYLGEEYVNRMPTFDARVWQVPTKEEAANVFLWRERDATKNSVSMAASCYYSHKEMHGKNGNQQQDMLFAKGINWNDYPARQKRGAHLPWKSLSFYPKNMKLEPIQI